MAAQSDYASLQVLALDCFEKLISYDYYDNFQSPLDDVKSVNTEEGVNPNIQQKLIDNVIETVCECFIGESTDDNVTLQIVKALLAAVASSTCPIHESTLLRAIRTTYNIFLLSRSAINQTIAQGTLTQMVNIVFVRAHESGKIQLMALKDSGVKLDDLKEAPGFINDQGKPEEVNEEGTKNVDVSASMPQRISSLYAMCF